MYSSLPAWFVLTPGFRWFDSDGELCVLLGWEPECETRTDRNASTTIDGKTYFFAEFIYKPQMTYVTWHKNTWIVRDLDDLRGLESGSPCPDDHPILARLMKKDTFKHMNKERCERNAALSKEAP